MLVVALLTVDRAELARFRRYETAAAAIMRRHGGAIERALVLDPDPALPTLRELHIVRFADAAGFAAYRDDPALAALAGDRVRCVIATELWPAADGPAY